MALPSLLTRQEAADCARISTVTLRKLLKKGCGPALTVIGGKSFVTDAELSRWIAAQTQPSQAAYSVGTDYTAELMLRNDAA